MAGAGEPPSQAPAVFIVRAKRTTALIMPLGRPAAVLDALDLCLDLDNGALARQYSAGDIEATFFIRTNSRLKMHSAIHCNC